MDTAQQDLSLHEAEAENVIGGREVREVIVHKTAKISGRTSRPAYVPGDTGVVNPSSSGMAGSDDDSVDDEC